MNQKEFSRRSLKLYMKLEQAHKSKEQTAAAKYAPLRISSRLPQFH